MGVGAKAGGEKATGIEVDTITFSALISACEKGGQWERVLELVREMEGKGIESNTNAFNTLIQACEGGGGDFSCDSFRRCYLILDSGSVQSVVSQGPELGCCKVRDSAAAVGHAARGPSSSRFPPQGCSWC